jgi:CheY-like chemotaxis protein
MAGDFVVISVADSGTGIEPEVVERVFEPFFTTKPHGQGTGLGLSQVYGLCTQAGGTATIASVVGRGTEVKLFLRAVRKAHAPGPGTSTSADESLDCTILLVEDNEDLAGVTTALLEAAGATVLWAANGDAAHALIETDAAAFDVVISDMSMPGTLDGLGLAEYLQRHRPGLPVVLITGYASQLHEAAARRFTVLSKPCQPDALIAAVRAAARRAPVDEPALRRATG